MTDGLNEPITCPRCNGKGEITIDEQSKRNFLESLEHWAALQETPNARLADMVSEIENYLRWRDLSPLVFQWLGEVWWRLHAADESIEETRRKIQAKQDDPVWLESD